jgi:hypothetical protein
METARNFAILSGVADAFVEGVLRMCKHPTLQYQWMRFFPQDKNVPEPFWKMLISYVSDAVKKTPVLRPRSGGPLRKLKELRIIPDVFKDRYGEPLFRDLEEELYLSSKYTQSDRQVLKALGLSVMSLAEVYARVEYDISRPTSRLKFTKADEDWHSKTAALMLLPFTDDDFKSLRKSVKELRFVPLVDGTWTSIVAGPIFFPDAGGMTIPADLPMRIIDDQAIRNSERRKLFEAIGVDVASPEIVRNSIQDKHRRTKDRLTLESAIQHLHYLYWTHTKTNEVYSDSQGRSPYWWLLLFDYKGDKISRDSEIYLQTSGRFDVQELVKPVPSSSSSGTEHVPQLSLHFLHPMYFESAPQNQPPGHPSWNTWLKDILGISACPRLLLPSGKKLSDTFLYIAQNYADRLLGALRTHWKVYLPQITDKVRAMVGSLEVPVIDPTKRHRYLFKTHLPTENLKDRCSRFIPYHNFPFVQLSDGEQVDKYTFLEEFGVGITDDLAFVLDIHEYCFCCKKEKLNNVYTLYEAIQHKLWASTDISGDVEKVQ